MAMKLVLREDPIGDEWEPTPGAPCLEDLEVLEEEDIAEVEATLYTREETVYDVLLDEPRYEVYLRVQSTMPGDCIRVLELRVKGCGKEGVELLKNAEWPEVSRVVIEGDCVELVVPSEPQLRIKNALKKLGVEKVKPVAFRPSYDLNTL
jgi:hypothetical protein